MEKLFLIDAYALIFRFYYAFVNAPMRNPEGINVSAVYGFAKFLGDLIARECPEHLGVAFDPRGGNFRHKMYEAYKANRDETPEDIRLAVPLIKEILEAMNIPILEVDGYEADDVIGTLAIRAAATGQYRVFMVTPDKDYAQLVRPEVFMYKPGKSGSGVEVWGVSEVCTAFEVNDPIQVIDILAVWGDASDNIPGVPGIGEKGAKKLIGQYGSVEGLIAAAESGAIKTKQGASVVEHQAQLRLSKELATICLDVPIECSFERLVMERPRLDDLRAIYVRHGFRSLLSQLESDCLHAAAGGRTVSGGKSYSEQVTSTLFDAPAASAPTPQIEASAHFATVQNTEHSYTTVTTMEGLTALATTLRAAGRFCFDTETTSLSAVGTTLVGISFSIEAHTAWWVPTPRGSVEVIVQTLKPLFEDQDVEKIGHNLKYDLLVLRNYGVEVRGRFWDTMILHYLLDAEGGHSMNYLSRAFLGYDPIPIETLIGKGARQLSMDRVAPHLVAEYGAEDADVTFQLFEKLMPLAEERGVLPLYERIEEPLIGVLTDMEWTGVAIDRGALAASAVLLNERLAAIEDTIRAVEGAPKELNINSAKQLGELLFDVLKIDPKAKKTKTGQYKTDEETLAALADRHPMVGQVLDYRGVKKLLSTYVEALPELVNPRDGRLHTSFNQAVTLTGRLSSSNPNLQNIPIRDEEGAAIRDAFVAGPEGWVILSADYSQVELRIMAHLADDAAMKAAFASGEDIHTATAAKIFHVSPAEVTSEERRRAKTANFGIIYGISQFGLAARLGIGREEAKYLIDGYFDLYPGVRDYMHTTIEQARVDGYVETMFGRRRYVPDVVSSNGNVRANAERTAVNTPIQGTAADLMKLAMVEVARALRAAGLQARMVLQVHDEIVVEAPAAEAERVTEILIRSMEGVASDLSVRLPVEVGCGRSWRAAH